MADALGWVVNTVLLSLLMLFGCVDFLGGPMPGGGLGAVAVVVFLAVVNGLVHALVGWGVEDAGTLTLPKTFVEVSEDDNDEEEEEET